MFDSVVVLILIDAWGASKSNFAASSSVSKPVAGMSSIACSSGFIILRFANASSSADFTIQLPLASFTKEKLCVLSG